MSDFDFDGPCTPGDAEWQRRLDLFVNDPSPIQWWWLSFVDTDLSAPPDEQVPGGGGFLGVCIIPAPNIVIAAQLAHELGCNPGGQIAAFPLPLPDGHRPRPEYIGRLFGAELGDIPMDELCEPPL